MNQDPPTLHDFMVLHTLSENEEVIIHAYDGRQVVNGFIPVVHLDDHFQREHLTDRQAVLVVKSNKEELSCLISDKYARGKWEAYDRYGSTPRRVDVTLADLDNCGKTLSDSVVDIAARSGWADKNGRIQQG